MKVDRSARVPSMTQSSCAPNPGPCHLPMLLPPLFELRCSYSSQAYRDPLSHLQHVEQSQSSTHSRGTLSSHILSPYTCSHNGQSLYCCFSSSAAQCPFFSPRRTPRCLAEGHGRKLAGSRPNKANLDSTQADSLTEEQVSEFKEAFSLFVSHNANTTQPCASASLLIWPIHRTRMVTVSFLPTLPTRIDCTTAMIHDHQPSTLCHRARASECDGSGSLL